MQNNGTLTNLLQDFEFEFLFKPSAKLHSHRSAITPMSSDNIRINLYDTSFLHVEISTKCACPKPFEILWREDGDTHIRRVLEYWRFARRTGKIQ